MLRRIIMTLIAAVAVAGFVFAFSTPKQEVAGPMPPAIERVSPAGGDLDLRQITIAADLAPGYTGYLLLDGVEVPRDDLQIVPALNSITLLPLPGSDYEALQPGSHCATVVYRMIGQPETESDQFRWCFKLH
ncbi:MAG: hypothetical protein QOE93_2339 [Actinomycetota bacterium]|jgi:hypothetical protein|nr:hypothetical protein [Actinomycetota bacterium]